MVALVVTFALWSFQCGGLPVRRSRTIVHHAQCSPSAFDTEFPPENSNVRKLMSLGLAHLYPNALRAFIELDLLSRLSLTTPKSVDQLMETNVGWNRDAIDRILLVLSTQNVVKRTVALDGGTLYAATELSVLLQEPGASSMVLHWTDPLFCNSWNQLSPLCKGSITDMFEAENRKSIGESYDQYPASRQPANTFVDWIGQLELQACVEGFDWALLLGKSILDLGGHDGKVLQAVTSQFNNIRGICLDRQSVIERVSPELRNSVSYVAGDILDRSSWPACDAIFMKHIIYCDWDGPQSQQILQSCADHIPPEGLLVVGEMCRDDRLSILSDAYMLLGSRESGLSRVQWSAAAKLAGLELVSVAQTDTPTCSILVFRKPRYNPR